MSNALSSHPATTKNKCRRAGKKLMILCGLALVAAIITLMGMFITFYIQKNRPDRIFPPEEDIEELTARLLKEERR